MRFHHLYYAVVFDYSFITVLVICSWHNIGLRYIIQKWGNIVNYLIGNIVVVGSVNKYMLLNLGRHLWKYELNECWLYKKKQSYVLAK